MIASCRSKFGMSHCMITTPFTLLQERGRTEGNYLFHIFYLRFSGGAGVIAARGQVYMGAPIGVVEIHLRAKLPPV